MTICATCGFDYNEFKNIKCPRCAANMSPEMQAEIMLPKVEKEMVNHPAHYGGEDNPYEAIKVIVALGWGEGFCLGSALKYLVRQGKKSDQIQDLEKAAWYTNYWVDYLKSEGIPKSEEVKRLEEELKRAQEACSKKFSESQN